MINEILSKRPLKLFYLVLSLAVRQTSAGLRTSLTFKTFSFDAKYQFQATLNV